jgi:mono/diheme cytochrome c family protein
MFFRCIESPAAISVRTRIIGSILLTGLPALIAATASMGADQSSMTRQQYLWVMHCQGCHGVDAQGSPGGAPRLTDNVARFLQVKDGRAFLGRVPGVAFVDLSDLDVANLLSWVVQHFDPAHVPKTFTPYSEVEIRDIRRKPLISSAYQEREKILHRLRELQDHPTLRRTSK